MVLPQVINRDKKQCFVNVLAIVVIGLQITEVAHDNCSSVKTIIERDFKMINSFDTWHGKFVEHTDFAFC